MQRFTLLTGMVLGMLISCGGCACHDSLSVAYKDLVFSLGDERLPMEKRATAVLLLSDGDKEVLPILIDHLEDQRVHNPAYTDISESADADTKPPQRVLTVGEKCRSLLLERVFGTVRLPQGVRQKDWRKWWDQNKAKSFYVIREEAKEELHNAEKQ